MIMSDVSRALLLLSIPVAYLLGGLSIYLLFIVGFATGVFTVIFDVTYQAYLPSLVDREQLVDANGKLQTSAATAAVVGPSLAGGLINFLAAPLAILFDSFSFVWSAISLSWIRRKEVPVVRESSRSTLGDIKEGLGVVLGNRNLRSIAGCTATANLFGSMVNAVMLLYAVNVLGMSPFLIGIMLALGSVGALTSAIVAARLSARIKVGRLIVISAFGFSGAYLLLIPAVPPNGSYFLIIAFFITSFASVTYNISQVSYRQALVPTRLQGRLNATMRFIVWGTLPVGALIGGLIGQVVGLYPALIVGAAGGTFSFLWVLFSPVRKVERIPTASEMV